MRASLRASRASKVRVEATRGLGFVPVKQMSVTVGHVRASMTDVIADLFK